MFTSLARSLIVQALAVLLIGTALSSAASAQEIIIDHRIVHSTLAYGTVSVNGGPFADLDALFVSNDLSEQVAQGLGDDYFGGPPFEALVDAYGTLDNLAFLLGPLVYLGDPVVAVEDAFADYLADINTAIGGGTVLSMSTAYRGTQSYALYGGEIPPPPGYDHALVTGEAHVALYEISAHIDIPTVPEPGVLALLGLGLALVGLAQRSQKAKEL